MVGDSLDPWMALPRDQTTLGTECRRGREVSRPSSSIRLLRSCWKCVGAVSPRAGLGQRRSHPFSTGVCLALSSNLVRLSVPYQLCRCSSSTVVLRPLHLSSPGSFRNDLSLDGVARRRLAQSRGWLYAARLGQWRRACNNFNAVASVVTSMPLWTWITYWQ